MNASLISIASYVPPRALTNFDLEKMVDTSDEWIVQRTGIRTRYIADGLLTSDLGARAGRLAIERAGLNPADIDAIICATVTPDHFCMPSTACKIAEKLGITGVMAFDISAACSGFVYAMDIARSLVCGGAHQNVLIIGAEKLSSIVDWTDRKTCVLFGDGAGAGVVSRARENSANFIIDAHCASDGSKSDLLITPGPGSSCPASHHMIEEGACFVHMAGNEVFKVAVQTLKNDVVEILRKNAVPSDAIDLFVPHQANLRIIDAVKTRLSLRDEQCVITVQKYGNTSSASIPMALSDAFEDGRLRGGSLVLIDAFGGGFTWGSALFRFGI